MIDFLNLYFLKNFSSNALDKELIIPDTLLEIGFFGNNIFLGTQLPLLTQKKIKTDGVYREILAYKKYR